MSLPELLPDDPPTLSAGPVPAADGELVELKAALGFGTIGTLDPFPGELWAGPDKLLNALLGVELGTIPAPEGLED